jgi:hypothetical protein
MVRGRFPFETLKKKVMELKRRFSPSTLLIEESPISIGFIQSLCEKSGPRAFPVGSLADSARGFSRCLEGNVSFF